jgi:hypothetical protein
MTNETRFNTKLMGVNILFIAKKQKGKYYLVITHINNESVYYDFTKTWSSLIELRLWFDRRIKANSDNIRALSKSFGYCETLSDKHLNILVSASKHKQKGAKVVSKRRDLIYTKVQYHRVFEHINRIKINGKDMSVVCEDRPALGSIHSSNITKVRHQLAQFVASEPSKKFYVRMTGMKSGYYTHNELKNCLTESTYYAGGGKGNKFMENRNSYFKLDSSPSMIERMEANERKEMRGQFSPV